MPRSSRLEHTPASLVETIITMRKARTWGQIRTDVAERVTNNAMDGLVALFPGDEDGIGQAVCRLELLEQAEIMKRWYMHQRLIWNAGEFVAREGQPSQ